MHSKDSEKILVYRYPKEFKTSSQASLQVSELRRQFDKMNGVILIISYAEQLENGNWIVQVKYKKIN